MKELYLPNLKNIKISNYTLYQQEPTFEYEFKDGINAVVGANGIGKTTFVNVVIYCLVGHKKKRNKITKNSKKPEYVYIDEDFFSSRIDNEADDIINMSAQATLEYYLGKTKIMITRSLIENSINELRIDDEEIVQANDSMYQELIEKYSKISQFQDFELLVREFLFFDERRNNVAWEIDSQDNILRILLLKEQYHLKINELEDKITKADTKGRHTSEDKRVAETSYRELVKARDDILDQTREKSDNEEREDTTDNEANRERLVLRKNRIDTEIYNKKETLSALQETVQEILEDVSLMEGNLANLSVSYDNIVSEIKKLETILYKSIYNKLPDYYYTIEKNLLTEGKCLVCNTKSRDIQKKANEIKQNGKCLICESELTENIPVDDNLIEKLNCLHEEKKEKLNELNNQKNQLDRLNSKFQQHKKDIDLLKNELENLKRAKIVVESELSQNTSESDKGDMYTEILKSKEKVIADLEIAIREAYNERDSYKRELLEYTQKFKSVINNLNQRLSNYFNKYASTFIGVDCKLSVTGKTLNKIPHFYYVPEINGQVRKDIWSVSESQRFFIDQAFRMAIIDYLQNDIGGFSTFFITETPEGSLDIAYESQVAMMFKIFSESNNKIIFTSNLNSSNFLKELYRGIPKDERPLRTLDLLRKGKVTRVQKNKWNQLENIVQEIMEA